MGSILAVERIDQNTYKIFIIVAGLGVEPSIS